jgi:hypothetical protein
MFEALEICGLPGMKGCLQSSQKVGVCHAVLRRAGCGRMRMRVAGRQRGSQPGRFNRHTWLGPQAVTQRRRSRWRQWPVVGRQAQMFSTPLLSERVPRETHC